MKRIKKVFDFKVFKDRKEGNFESEWYINNKLSVIELEQVKELVNRELDRTLEDVKKATVG